MQGADTSELAAARRMLPKGLSRAMRWLLVLGAALLLLGMLLKLLVGSAGAVTSAELFTLFLDPARAWPNFLLASTYLIGLGLGASVFLALQYVTGAGWSVAFRRVPEAMTAVLPVAGLMLIAGLAAGLPHLYAWSHEDAVAGDAVLRGKSGWLQGGFFLGRAVVYLAIWILFARALVRNSRRQDEDGDPSRTRANARISAAFLVVFGLTLSAASFDWIMSLDAHWFSTIFAVYSFAGLMVSGLAGLTVAVILLRRRGPLRHAVTPEHLHGLGKLLLAFATFWAYIWFCQYMLIWYTNMPEETAYFMSRHGGSWGPLAMTNLILNWAVPFLVLLPRPAKRSETVLLVVSGILLAGRWLDLFVMILPPFSDGGPSLGVWELGAVGLVVGVFALVVSAAFSRTAPVPARDPLLAESLGHHQ